MGDNDILWFDIPMTDTKLVQIINGRYKLAEIYPTKVLVEPNIINNQLKKLNSLDKFSDNIEIFLGLLKLQELDDVRVFYF